MWVILIEKAFAKFCGDYNSLKGGQMTWAFQVTCTEVTCTEVTCTEVTCTEGGQVA